MRGVILIILDFNCGESMSVELFTGILEALNYPFAVKILTYLLHQGEAKLSDILMFVSGISKYRSVRKTILSLEAAGLITRKVISWGRVKRWNIKLTELGERIASSILESIKTAIKEH